VIEEKEQEILILRGVPASGKSTFCDEMLKTHLHFKRISRDEFRSMLDNYSHDFNLENAINKLMESSLKILLKAGYSVVIDNTNLRPKYVKDILKIRDSVGKKIKVRLKSFDVTLDEAIERDSKRKRKVGAEVINKMYAAYKSTSHRQMEDIIHTWSGLGDFAPYVEVEGLPFAILVDIDGTLAHMKDRSPYHWNRVGEDEIDHPVREMIKALSNFYDIIVLSGRDAVCRKETEEWLNLHGVPFKELWMRPENDQRKDTVVKDEIYENHIKGRYNVLLIADDRQSVVDMWRSKGMKVAQVAYGDF
jgi:predicted kinase